MLQEVGQAGQASERRKRVDMLSIVLNNLVYCQRLRRLPQVSYNLDEAFKVKNGEQLHKKPTDSEKNGHAAVNATKMDFFLSSSLL